MNIKDAARLFMYPKDPDVQMRFVKNRNILDDKYRAEYGSQAWDDACRKARTEYQFGTQAVKW